VSSPRNSTIQGVGRPGTGAAIRRGSHASASSRTTARDEIVRPGAPAPDAPEKVVPLPEPVAPGTRRQLPWARSAPPVPRAPAGPSAPMRNPAVEPPAEDDALDAAEQPIERRRDDAANGEASRDGLHSPAARSRGVDSETQTSGGNAEWTSLDLRRSLRLLRSTDEAVVKRTPWRLHIRFWHASAAKLTEILRFAGAPRSALRLIKDIVDTCRICRAWQRPTPKAMTSVRMARDFQHLVQWDISSIAGS